MKQGLNNIGVLVMLIAFLVSASGFQLIRHTCPSCNIVEYTLHQPDACCGETASVTEGEPVSCCTIPGEPQPCNTAIETTSCCEYESEYFVVDELVSPQKLKVEASLVMIPLLAELQPILETAEDHVFRAAFLHPPPPPFSGTEYLFFLQQLKIAFC